MAMAGLLSFGSQPRGLVNFISDIRNVKSKDEERTRIDKELGNIRLKFSSASTLTSYQKKKYVWKMCYIYMLGYEVDFGHSEFISIIGSQKYQEKAVGYMAVSMMIRPGDELLTLVINSMRNDLCSNSNFSQSLSLSVVANLGGGDLASALGNDVERLLMDSEVGKYGYSALSPETEARNRCFVRKKAALCLSQLFRSNPENLDLDIWASNMERILEENDLGLLNSAMSLALYFANHKPESFGNLVKQVISILDRLIITRSCTSDYLYYRIPCPWLQCKCLKFLQLYSFPNDKIQSPTLVTVLKDILSKSAENAESINMANTINCILMDAVNLVILYGPDVNSEMHEQAISWLGRFIDMKDPNTRYLGIDAMIRYVKQHGPSEIKEHHKSVVASLKDLDVSIQKRSLELIYVMTDSSNAQETVAELCANLDQVDSLIKEDMVVKIALISETHASKNSSMLRWYIDTIIAIILAAGDFVSENVWHRVVQLVANHPEVQEYAAEKFMNTMQNRWVHDVAVALGAYILGEFGVNICENPGMSGYDQFAALHQHFVACNIKTQAILLTTYAKILNLYPDTKDLIVDLFLKLSSSPFIELQQRACEYLKLPNAGSAVMESVLKEMPPYPEERVNKLVRTEMKSNSLNINVRAPKPSSATTNFPTENIKKSVDLLSLDDHDVTSSPVATQQQTANLQTSYKTLLLTPPGQVCLLFEDDCIRVNYVAEFRGHQGRLSFQFVNKVSSSINDFNAFASMSANTEALKLNHNGLTNTISAGERGRLQISIECMRPFQESLDFYLSYTCASRDPVKLQFSLPLTVTSFFEPITLEKNDFMESWKAVEGPGTEVQETFASGQQITPELINNIRSSILPSLHLGMASGIDTPTTATASGTFRTGTMAADGVTPLVIRSLMRLEADSNSGKFRITVRCKNAVVAVSLKDTIKSTLI